MESYLNAMDVDLKNLYGIMSKKNKLDLKYSKKDLAHNLKF